MLYFSGRGVKQPIISTRILTPDTAVVRIDDDANPEYWSEVMIGRSELVALLAAMDAQAVDCPAGWDHV